MSEKQKDSNFISKYSWVALGTVITLMNFLQNPYVFTGEMWAEMGTNYFSQAKYNAPLLSLLATDSGYIPLPQRVISLLSEQSQMTASQIGYFYTYASITGSLVLLGIFLSKKFRPIVQNDGIRLVLAIFVYVATDWETKTYINFTYFLFFALLVALLLIAVTEPDEKISKWFYLVPIAFLSKPAVLSLTPLLIFFLIRKDLRSRVIGTLGILVSGFQLSSLLVNRDAGIFAQSSNPSITDSLISAAQYCFGYIFSAPFGRNNLPLSVSVVAFLGFVTAILAIVRIRSVDKPKSKLMSAVVLVMFFASLLNTFSMPDSWNIYGGQITDLPVFRHSFALTTTVFLFIAMGVDLIVSVLIRRQNKFILRRSLVYAAPLAMGFWFVLSGWAQAGLSANQAQGPPMLGNSQWQKSVAAIESGDDVCVPIDPFGWVFGVNCKIIYPGVQDVRLSEGYSWQGTPFSGGKGLKIEAPKNLEPKRETHLSFLVRPNDGQSSLILFKTTDSQGNEVSEITKVEGTGSLVTLNFRDSESVPSDEIIISANEKISVTVSLVSKEQTGILWMQSDPEGE